MELKEATNLPSPFEMNMQPLSQRNDPNNRRVYDILFPATEDAADPNIEAESSLKFQEKPLFGSVSTLDWLTTWRPLEIS